MRIRSSIAALGAALFLAACGTLPDAKPFADATGSLSASIRAGGTAVSSSFDEVVDADGQNSQNYVKLAKSFDQAWHARVAAAGASVDYADSIAGLVSAGKDGAETVGKVADSLSLLASAIGQPLAAAGVAVAKDAATFVYERIAIVRASSKLESALGEAQPAVDRLGTLLIEDCDQRLKPLLLDLHKNTLSAIKSDYRVESLYHKQLLSQRQLVLGEVLKDPGQLGKVQTIDRADQLVTASLQERDKRLDAAKAAYKSRLQLIDAISVATGAWVQAHRDLAAAVKDKRKVSVAELESTIKELNELIKKVRAL